MHDKVIDCLREARARIEKGWCQRAFARNDTGTEITSRAADASSWCGFGALYPYGDVKNDLEIRGSARDFLHKAGFFLSVNDAPQTTKEMVLKKYDEAIALAEAN